MLVGGQPWSSTHSGQRARTERNADHPDGDNDSVQGAPTTSHTSTFEAAYPFSPSGIAGGGWGGCGKSAGTMALENCARLCAALSRESCRNHAPYPLNIGK